MQNDIIVFDANRFFHAICYHLTQTHKELKDELRDAEYTSESLLQLYHRLQTSELSKAINRAKWARMTDWDRLCWLMKTTRSNVKPVSTGLAEVVADDDEEE